MMSNVIHRPAFVDVDTSKGRPQEGVVTGINESAVAMLRRSGASVRKLHKEQKAAEQKAPISALSKAKAVYVKRGDVNSCGDWLAVALKDGFRTKDGSFDLTAFKACLKDNGIEAPRVDMERRGAIGRFRMCAGLMLRRYAAKVGFLVIGGKRIQAPGTKKRGRKAKSAEAAKAYPPCSALD